MKRCQHSWETKEVTVIRKFLNLIPYKTKVQYVTCYDCDCLLIEHDTLTNEEIEVVTKCIQE